MTARNKEKFPIIFPYSFRIFSDNRWRKGNHYPFP